MLSGQGNRLNDGRIPAQAEIGFIGGFILGGLDVRTSATKLPIALFCATRPPPIGEGAVSAGGNPVTAALCDDLGRTWLSRRVMKLVGTPSLKRSDHERTASIFR